MRVQKIICDRCKKEIQGDPVKLFAEKVDPVTGDWSANKTMYPDIKEKEFCDDCSDFIHGWVNMQCSPRPDEVLTTAGDVPVEKSHKKNTPRKGKYDHDKIWELHEKGMRNVDIEKELGYPKTTVAWAICNRKKKLQEMQDTDEKKKSEYGDAGLEGKLQELEAEVKNADKPMPKSEKKPSYNPDLIIERSDDDRRVIVNKRKPTPKDKEPIKVCLKNCVVCKYSSQGGYCDYMTITGQSRGDKPGICTHRELRR